MSVFLSLPPKESMGLLFKEMIPERDQGHWAHQKAEVKNGKKMTVYILDDESHNCVSPTLLSTSCSRRYTPSSKCEGLVCGRNFTVQEKDLIDADLGDP